MTPLIVALLMEIAGSGRMVSIAESPSQRIATLARLSPGQPPLVAFRYFEARDRRRVSGLDLVLDDAGH
jgi:hypothetical protein